MSSSCVSVAKGGAIKRLIFLTNFSPIENDINNDKTVNLKLA